MKSHEFIKEAERGKLLAAQEKTGAGPSYTMDGFYELYRASMLMGRLPSDTDDIDPYSYVADRPMIITYADEEVEMVQQAFKKMGIAYDEHIKSKSAEPDEVNTKSPTVAFKGY